MQLLCSVKPEILTLGHKRVPSDSHYPPEQKKTVEEVEETAAEAVRRDGSTHVHAGHVRYTRLSPPSQIQCLHSGVGESGNEDNACLQIL